MSWAETIWQYYMDLAAAAFYLGEREQAISVLNKAAEEAAGFPWPNWRLADTLNQLGVLYAYEDRLAEAEVCLRRAREISEADAGADPLRLLTLVANLAAVYHAMGRHREAANHYERALEMAERACPPGDPMPARISHGLAEATLAGGRRTAALFVFERALRRQEEVSGREGWEIAVLCEKLAEWHLAEERYNQAEPLLWRVVRIKESLLGPGDAGLARHYRRLGELYAGQRKYSQADRMLACALKLELEAAAPRWRDLGTTLDVLAEAQQAQCRPGLAEGLRGLRRRAAESANGSPMPPDLAGEIRRMLETIAGFQEQS